MNTLQSAVAAVAIAFPVLAFSAGIKAACRKRLKRDKKYLTGIRGQNGLI